jgi:uncharacterized membrane protein YgcG
MAMKCPSCREPFPAPVLQCPRCKLTLRRLDTRFGAVPRQSRYLTDRSNRLSDREIQDLRPLLSLFRRKFPQAPFSVIVMPGIPGGTITEYVFWLANRARFSPIEATGGDNFDILLGIDVEKGRAALQVGYGLESYLAEADLEEALQPLARRAAEGNLAAGIRECVEFMVDRMRRLEKKAENAAAASAEMY